MVLALTCKHSHRDRQTLGDFRSGTRVPNRGTVAIWIAVDREPNPSHHRSHHRSQSHRIDDPIISKSAIQQFANRRFIGLENAFDYYVIRLCVNGKFEGSMPQYVDCVKSLPRPLPPATIAEPTKDEEMDEQSTANGENLCAKDLLQQHLSMLRKFE
ncbi:hypothetical protein Tco_1327018 [Tanacetum coccineum]